MANRWIHKKTGNKYYILYRTKIKLKGVWKNCIIYQCLYYNKDGMVWVRTVDDFYKNFEQTEYD